MFWACIRKCGVYTEDTTGLVSCLCGLTGLSSWNKVHSHLWYGFWLRLSGVTIIGYILHGYCANNPEIYYRAPVVCIEQRWSIRQPCRRAFWCLSLSSNMGAAINTSHWAPDDCYQRSRNNVSFPSSRALVVLWLKTLAFNRALYSSIFED